MTGREMENKIQPKGTAGESARGEQHRRFCVEGDLEKCRFYSGIQRKKVEVDGWFPRVRGEKLTCLCGPWAGNAQ